MTADAAPTIDRLLNLVPQFPATVSAHLQRHPTLASAQDDHGYSLLHAAASYGHLSLMRDLVRRFQVAPNIVDEDNETPLYAAETVDIARCLVEELGADIAWKNDEGLTAEEKIRIEEEWPLVAAYLHSRMASQTGAGLTRSSETASGQNGDSNASASGDVSSEGLDGDVGPSSLPPGVTIGLHVVEEDDGSHGQEPDPEFRQRIEALAARDDFQSEEGQRQLRELVKDAVADLNATDQDREVRRRR